jgi:hypothetical protein
MNQAVHKSDVSLSMSQVKIVAEALELNSLLVGVRHRSLARPSRSKTLDVIDVGRECSTQMSSVLSQNLSLTKLIIRP